MIKLSALHCWIVIISAGLFFDIVFAREFISYFVVFVVFSSLFVFNFNDNLKIVFFLIPSFYYFSITGISGNPLTYFLILLFLKYLFHSGSRLYNSFNLILTVIVLIVSVLSSLISNAYNFMELIRWGVLFVFAVLLMSERDTSRSFSDFGIYFIFGFFVSSIVGFVGFKIGGNLYDLTRAINNSNIINRFSGLSGDPNSYGMYALLVLSFLLIRLEAVINPKESALLWLLVISIGFLSILTVSRALVVGFVFIMLVFLMLNLRKRKNIKVFFILIFLMALGFLVGDYYGFFDNFIRRFEYSSLDELTGSRSIIFAEYITGFINGDFWSYLFGSGVVGYPDFYFYDVKGFNNSGYFSNAFGTHNTFVELLVSFGLLGSIPFLILLYRCVIKNQLRGSNRLRYFDFIPLLVIIIYFFSLHNLAKYNFYFILVLLSIYLNSRSKASLYK